MLIRHVRDAHSPPVVGFCTAQRIDQRPQVDVVEPVDGFPDQLQSDGHYVRTTRFRPIPLLGVEQCRVQAAQYRLRIRESAPLDLDGLLE
jgi:hypothetical protein